MNFAFTAEQTEWKRATRRFLSANCTSGQVRAAGASHAGYDVGAWGKALKLGWASLIVPTEYGGAGLGWTDLVATAEETGRVLACLPFLSSVCLATNALLAAADGAQLSAHLPRLASGETLAALAFAEGPDADPRAVTTIAREDSGGYRLSGTKRYVVDGHAADVLFVTARPPEASEPDDIALFVVDARCHGVERTRLPVMDLTRPQAAIALRDVQLDKNARMGDARTLRRALDRGAIALAAESLGGAERCLEMATEYAKARFQFGRPIGSFQAIKHKLADMLVAVETARSAVYYAACVADAGDDAELATAAPLAKSYCTEAFFHCAAESVQIHAGIGFTWEHDAHLFLKRARGSLTLLGSPAGDRERIASALGL
jgi:alkylation response protein AidB-like acyl-CoA dehydrogenase